MLSAPLLRCLKRRRPFSPSQSVRSASASASPTPRNRHPLTATAAAILAAAGGLYFYITSTPARPKHLNRDYFVPYNLVSVKPITTSPSHVSIFTLAPATPLPTPTPIGCDAAHSTEEYIESIEIKQPQLQIARSYTPLESVGAEDPIRLLIKREPSGEMSRYLFSLTPGADTIWVRGPHSEYCLSKPFTASSSTPSTRLLFLVGGTGVAPALQAAQKLLHNDPDAVMKIVWGVRHPEEAGVQMQRELTRLQDAFGARLEVNIDFDTREGGQGIPRGRVREAVTGWMPTRVVCSGPERFVAYWVGPKEWKDGKEVSGKTGGVVGEILKKSQSGAGERRVRVWKL